MTAAPIYSAIELVRYMIVPALKVLSGSAGVYWTEAPTTAARPFVVVQSQDSGGVSVLWLGRQGWSGLVTVKAIADALSVAESLLNTVAPAMDSLTAPSGYDLSIQFTRPLTIPPDGNVWQTGLIWNVQLERH